MASVFSPSGKKHPSCAETSPPHRRRTAPQSFARMRPSSFAGRRRHPAPFLRSAAQASAIRPPKAPPEASPKASEKNASTISGLAAFPVPTPSPYRRLPLLPPRHHVTTPPRHGIPTSRRPGIPTLPVRHPCVFSPFTVHISLPRPSPPPSPHRSLTTPPSVPPSPASVRNPPEMRNLSAPPLDTGRRYIKTYRNSQGGVQVPTGGEPPCAGQPAGAFSREKRRSGASPGPTVTVRKKENGFLASVF